MAKPRQRSLPLRGGRYDPKISGKERRARLIGHFGVKLAQKLLGGEILHDHDSRGDLVHHRQRFYAEVKMAGKDRTGFAEQQLENHLEGEDEYARLCVAVKYRSWDYDPGTQTIIRAVERRTKTEKELSRFLAANTSKVYVLDASIVCALGNKNPNSRWYLLRGVEKQPHIRITWSDLAALEKDFSGTLERWGLSPDEFSMEARESEVRVDRFKVRMRSVSILRTVEATAATAVRFSGEPASVGAVPF